MSISVVIPTLSRPESVSRLLHDLFTNTLLPDEVVVVEQGDIERTKEHLASFVEKGVRVVFQEEKSLPVARNTGIRETSGSVVVFLDDDMRIGTKYLETVKTYLDAHPDVLGLTGSYMKEAPAWTLKRFLGVLFRVYSLKSQNTILQSGANDYIRGRNLLKEQTVEWLYGGNMIFRREVFERGFLFNPTFKRWGFGEDVMLTYQVHKAFPGTLRYLPELEVTHTAATANKMPPAEALRMKVIYRYIFWKREVASGVVSTIAYIWSQIGLSGFDLIQYPSLRTLRALCGAYLYLLTHRSAIATETIDYNRFIFSKS